VFNGSDGRALTTVRAARAARVRVLFIERRASDGDTRALVEHDDDDSIVRSRGDVCGCDLQPSPPDVHV
jgi:hypothetical protein